MIEAGKATEARAKGRVALWPVALIGLPAFVALWSGWVEVGARTGFGEVHPFPGIPGAENWKINTAVTLPIGVEAYAAWAMWVWLALGERVRLVTARFAASSAIASLVLGAAGQAISHVMIENKVASAPAWVTVLVSTLPVIVVGCAAALGHMVHHDTRAGGKGSNEGHGGHASEHVSPPASRTVPEGTPRALPSPRPVASTWVTVPSGARALAVVPPRPALPSPPQGLPGATFEARPLPPPLSALRGSECVCPGAEDIEACPRHGERARRHRLESEALLRRALDEARTKPPAAPRAPRRPAAPADEVGEHRRAKQLRAVLDEASRLGKVPGRAQVKALCGVSSATADALIKEARAAVEAGTTDEAVSE